MEDYRLEQTGQEVQDILNGAAMDANLQAEVERATDAEGTLQGNIDAEERARQDADGLLQQVISDEENRATRAEEANAGEIEGIKALIPSTATPANKLADTDYVNSSIQTATAEYRGDYNVVTDLHLAIDATHAQIETLLGTVIAEADKNDYCYVMIPTNASTPTEIAKIERYKMTSEGWKFEYDVNNSTFTAEEWAAIKSGITSGLVAKLNALPTNADLLLLLAGKQDVLTFDSVPVPESNNPVKSGGVYSAIDDEKTARLNSDTAIHTELDGLQAKVPATASSDNKLVDQNQMNSSISTATATYRGDWNVVSDLHLAVDATRAQIAALLPTVISTADNNDYCYVEIPTSAETPTQIERVERYKFNGTAWAYEYTLNNSGFTADQWAAINSMITSGLVAKLSALPTNADLLAMLAQKQDNLTFDTTPTENSQNPVTSGGVFAADKALSDAIEAILLLIPSAASALNKLVDTSLMNSSISTATATFMGTYNLVSDLGLGIDATEGQIAAALLSAISTADNNDYAFVQIPTSAETPAQIARTDRYKFNGTAWGYEYTLNTSGFTAAQWAAINSTITSALVAKLNALPTALELQEAIGILTTGITAINQKIPSTASQSNKLVDNASMESYIAQVINILDASFNVTSTDGHITLHITQVDGKITAVQVQSSDIASAAELSLKANQSDLAALGARVGMTETNISGLTTRIGTAEVNISNLQQLYNNLQQSKPVPVTTLPTSGQQQGVIYRLAGSGSYSDYMWNGTSWVLMATYNNAVDTEPILNSENLAQSGGIALAITKVGGKIELVPGMECDEVNGYVRYKANVYYGTTVIKCSEGDVIGCFSDVHNIYSFAIAFFNDFPTASTPSTGGRFISGVKGIEDVTGTLEYKATAPAGTAYAIVSGTLNGGCYGYIESDNVYIHGRRLNELKKEIDDLEKETIGGFDGIIESYEVGGNYFVKENSSYIGEIKPCTEGDVISILSKLNNNKLSYAISFWSAYPTPSATAQDASTFISGIKADSEKHQKLTLYTMTAPAGAAYVVVSSTDVDGAGWADSINVRLNILEDEVDDIINKDLSDDSDIEFENREARIRDCQNINISYADLPVSSDGTGIGSGFLYIDSNNNIKIA